jgi:hypothetical protein
MTSPDDYEEGDDSLMDSLQDAMEGYDAKHQAKDPTSGGMTVTLNFNAANPVTKPVEEEKPDVGDDAMFPTPEELEEMTKMS